MGFKCACISLISVPPLFSFLFCEINREQLYEQACRVGREFGRVGNFIGFFISGSDLKWKFEFLEHVCGCINERTLLRIYEGIYMTKGRPNMLGRSLQSGL